MRKEPEEQPQDKMRENKRLLSRVSLRVFLIVPFAILFTAIIGALTISAYKKGHDAVEQVKVKIRERTVVGVREKLAEYMNTAHRINIATSNYISKDRLDIRDPIALQDFFWNQLKVNENINYVYFGYKNGGILLIARQSDGRFVVRQTGINHATSQAGRSRVYELDENGNRANMIEERSFFDSRTRPWFKKAIQQKGPIWTKVYTFFLENTLGITAAYPLYDKQGDVLGVISTDILLTTFNTILKGLKPVESSELFVINKEGLLLASTFNETLVRTEYDKPKPIKANQSKSPVIRAAYDHFSKISHISKAGQEIVEDFDVQVGGVNHLVKIFSFRDSRGIDWRIGLTVSEQDILGPGRETLGLIVYFGVVAMMLSIMLCMVLGNTLMWPLRNLQQVAIELFNGKLETRAKPSRIFELDTLSNSFNSMAAEIQSYVAELRKKNNDLNAQIKHRKQVEKKLRYFKEEVEIKQRTKLAGELHDGIGQSLQAINLGLKMLDNNEGNSAKSSVQLKDLISEVGVAIEQLRDIIDQQYPVFLDQMDIQTAMEHYGRKLAQRGGFEFTLESHIDQLELAPILKEPIFLIFQEALNNTAKYSKASLLIVTLEIIGDNILRVIIEDNGVGFDYEKTRKSNNGLGLSLMLERAQSIDSTLHIRSVQNHGTRLIMEIPLND